MGAPRQTKSPKMEGGGRHRDAETTRVAVREREREQRAERQRRQARETSYANARGRETRACGDSCETARASKRWECHRHGRV